MFHTNAKESIENDFLSFHKQKWTWLYLLNSYATKAFFSLKPERLNLGVQKDHSSCTISVQGIPRSSSWSNKLCKAFSMLLLEHLKKLSGDRQLLSGWGICLFCPGILSNFESPGPGCYSKVSHCLSSKSKEQNENPCIGVQINKQST